MTTTTRTSLETDKVVSDPVADRGVEQQGKAMDEAAPAPVPWSELAPSDYAALARWSAFKIPDEELQAPAMAAAVPKSVLWSGLNQPYSAVPDSKPWLAYQERQGQAMAAAVSRGVHRSGLDLSYGAVPGSKPWLAYQEGGSVAEPAVDGKGFTRAALLAAVLALVETRVAHLTIEEKHYVFGLFVSRTAWVSKGDSQESWPGGSIESSLQASLQGTPVTVRNLVAKWIGPVRPDPWGEMRDRIVNRLVRQGTVERHQEKQSFLFFSWETTTHRPANRAEAALSDYASVAHRTGLGLPLLDRSLLRLAQRDVISSEIDKGFTDRTEVPPD